MKPYFNQPLLPLLSASLQDALHEAGDERSFQDGQTIHTRGDDRPGLSIILKGLVRFGTVSKDGEYIQTSLLGAGHCFGEATLFAGMTRAYDADAVGETAILDIVRPRCEKLIEQYPEFSKALLVTITKRLYASLDIADDLRRLPLKAQVAKYLIRLAVISASPGKPVPVRQADIAFALGVSRVSVGKILDALQRSGYIALGYREITIVDGPGLVNWVQEHRN